MLELILQRHACQSFRRQRNVGPGSASSRCSDEDHGAAAGNQPAAHSNARNTVAAACRDSGANPDGPGRRCSGYAHVGTADQPAASVEHADRTCRTDQACSHRAGRDEKA